MFRPVAFAGAPQFREHRPLMLGARHIDEIDDDDATEVSQAQLPRNDLRRLQIRLENRFRKIPPSDKASGVDVNRRHCFRLIHHEVATAF